jgi:diguanylate cyclase (GGDEF)-like protein
MVEHLISCLDQPLPRCEGQADARRYLADRVRDAVRASEVRLSRLQQRVTQLETLALTDELTGLANRRGFEQELKRAIALARRYGEEGVLIYLDVDDFKLINDTFGHPAGDAVLQRIGRLLVESVRCTDTVARIGGDEFAVLMPRSDWSGGVRRAQALGQRLECAEIVWKKKTIAFSASVGVHRYRGEDMDSESQLLALADQRMYEVKRLRQEPVRRSMIA